MLPKETLKSNDDFFNNKKKSVSKSSYYRSYWVYLLKQFEKVANQANQQINSVKFQQEKIQAREKFG